MTPFFYVAQTDRVIDADTVDFEIFLGFDIKRHTRVRFVGIDAPETRTRDAVEKQAGLAAKAWLEQQLPQGSKVYVHSTDYDKYGRCLGRVYLIAQDANGNPIPGLCLNDELLRLGHAKPYGG